MDATIEREIIKQYEDGISTIQIAKDFQINRATIYHILKRNDMSPTRREAGKIKKQKVVTMYEENMSLKDIEREIGEKERYAEGVIYRNVKGCRYTKLTQKQKEEIREKYNGGISIDELAKEYKCGKTTIWLCLKD